MKACEEDERCEEESECHSAAKRARVCATFTDSQENAIVEFVKEHPELYIHSLYTNNLLLGVFYPSQTLNKNKNFLFL